MKVEVKELIKIIPQEELLNLGVEWILEDTVVVESTIDAETENVGLFIYVEDERKKR